MRLRASRSRWSVRALAPRAQPHPRAGMRDPSCFSRSPTGQCIAKDMSRPIRWTSSKTGQFRHGVYDAAAGARNSPGGFGPRRT